MRIRKGSLVVLITTVAFSHTLASADIMIMVFPFNPQIVAEDAISDVSHFSIRLKVFR